MVSSLKPSAEQFLINLNRIGDNMTRAQSQLSTGLRVQQVSDSPDVISTLLQARASLDHTQQINSNLGRVKTEVDSAEQAMQNAVSLFENVRTLSAEGNTGTQTASGRADLAQQLQAIEQQMVGLSNTSVEGRYVFSGDSDQTSPYIYDPSQTNPVSAYQGSNSTRSVQHPNGTTFTVALTAQQIFDSNDPATNVFTSINNLVTALKNNDDTAISTANDSLSKVGEYLNNQLAFYGTTQNKVSEATNYGATLVTQLQTQISGLQDADETQSILELTQAQTQQQAALVSRAQLPRTTLFDYLA